jgi:hypothetical protein
MALPGSELRTFYCCYPYLCWLCDLFYIIVLVTIFKVQLLNPAFYARFYWLVIVAQCFNLSCKCDLAVGYQILSLYFLW